MHWVGREDERVRFILFPPFPLIFPLIYTSRTLSTFSSPFSLLPVLRSPPVAARIFSSQCRALVVGSESKGIRRRSICSGSHAFSPPASSIVWIPLSLATRHSPLQSYPAAPHVFDVRRVTATVTAFPSSDRACRMCIASLRSQRFHTIPCPFRGGPLYFPVPMSVLAWPAYALRVTSGWVDPSGTAPDGGLSADL